MFGATRLNELVWNTWKIENMLECVLNIQRMNIIPESTLCRELRLVPL